MRYEVKKIDRNANWGIKDTTTGRYKPNYDNCFDKWTVGLNKITGQLNTGLTLAEEKEFEKELNLIDGTLGKGSSYWDNFIIVIPDKGLELFDDSALHRLFLKLLKSDPSIAHSLQDSETKSNVDYVIITETGEAKIKNKKREVLKNAYVMFDKMTESDIVDALYLIGKDPSSTDNEVCANILGEYLENDPYKFVELFGDDELKSKVFIIKLIRLGVIKKQGVGSGYEASLYFEDTLLGKGLENANKFLKQAENQSIFLTLKKLYKEAIRS